MASTLTTKDLSQWLWAVMTQSPRSFVPATGTYAKQWTRNKVLAEQKPSPVIKNTEIIMASDRCTQGHDVIFPVQLIVRQGPGGGTI